MKEGKKSFGVRKEWVQGRARCDGLKRLKNRPQDSFSKTALLGRIQDLLFSHSAKADGPRPGMVGGGGWRAGLPGACN